MNSFRLITTTSPWLILACLLAGALYAWLLYSKKSPWPASINYGLAALRFVVVSMVAFLLLGPLVRYLKNTTKKPLVVFAIDNSRSVSLFTDSVQLRQTQQGLQSILTKLQTENFDTQIRLLQPDESPANLNQITFTGQTSNLSQLLTSVQEEFAQENLAGVVLLSDGIVNQGISPAQSSYTHTLYAVAVGDTIPKKDIILASLRYNKVNYSGTRFPLEAEVQHVGFGGATATVVLKENGNIIQRKSITLKPNQPVQPVAFQVMAAGLGKRHYEVEILARPDEFTKLNNTKHAYIDVVKGKIKILVAAAAPHPDIKALRAAIESNENYETDLFIPGLAQLKQQNYDVAVLHQLPGRTGGAEAVLNLVRSKNLPALYIIGPQSDFAAFNNLRLGLTITSNGQTDEVTGAINPTFKGFQLPEQADERMPQYPPALVPFGEYRTAGNSEIILYQQVGRVQTKKPLLTVHTSGDKRNAVLLASGTWQWRLSEAAEHKTPEVYDQLITNLIQLLNAPRNKKRLNVYPVQDEYTSTEEIRFNAEVYNEALEPVYGQNIALAITDVAGTTRNFNFANGENQAGVNIGTLPGGRYTYAASARLDGTVQQDKGEFIVEELQLEALNAVADHNLLYQLGANSGSSLYFPGTLAQLQTDILKADHKPVIYSEEELTDVIDLKWLFFVLLAFVSIEWFIRKYNGSY